MDASATTLDPNFIFALVAGIVGMLSFSLVVILFVVFYQRRMVRQREKMSQLETEYQKDLLNSAIQAQEQERKRIAVDLHDGIGGLLSATKLYINQLGPDTPADDSAIIKDEASALIDESIGNIRTISRNLLPASLDELGLIPAVEGLSQRFREFLPIELDYTQNLRFNSAKEVALYRVIQELLNNTLKHAEAQQAHISFQFSSQKITITYRDNGKGFDRKAIAFNQPNSSGGLGLKSIESRVNSIGGTLDFQTQVHQGIQVKIDAPLK